MDPNNSTRVQELIDAIIRKTSRLTAFFEAVGRTTRLHALVVALQRKWGPAAFRRLRGATPPTVASISTGYEDLDRTLEIGGFPRGHITELLGPPTSGIGALAFRCVATAQATGDTVAYLDIGGTFDADYAATCGVELSDLLLVQPHTAVEALEMLRDLVAGGALGLLVVDSIRHLVTDEAGIDALGPALQRVAISLRSSPCAVVMLTPQDPERAAHFATPGGFSLAHEAALRLQCSRQCWHRRHRDIVGYDTIVYVGTNKLGKEGTHATIAVKVPT